jgi:hypothetical protein
MTSSRALATWRRPPHRRLDHTPHHTSRPVRAHDSPRPVHTPVGLDNHPLLTGPAHGQYPRLFLNGDATSPDGVHEPGVKGLTTDGAKEDRFALACKALPVEHKIGGVHVYVGHGRQVQAQPS